MYSTATDSRTIENLGELKLHFGDAKQAKSVKPVETWLSPGELPLKQQICFSTPGKGA
jgi:hypothetical protein